MKFVKKIFIFTIALILCVSTLSCGEKQIADNTEHFDKITKTLTLTRTDYEDKSFLTQGIGLATVDAYTDGDTVRFKTAQGEIIAVRFYQVDTPESTSNVDKWGKAASKFTKDCLLTADTIVLEATSDRAQHDSYGTRYLAYIWYRTEGSTTFKNLNLELVENGYSENKGVNTSAFPYYSYFDKAQKFAESIELRLFSKLDDPLYTTDPVKMTLKEFYNNTDAFYNSDSDSGAKVNFTACFTSLYMSQSGTYMYTALEIDPQTGEYNTINIYAGYSSSPASKMKLGHLYDITGTVAYYGGNFQISGITYDTLFTMPGYTKVIQKDYLLTFNTNLTFIDQYTQTLYTDATVVSSSVSGSDLVVTCTAQQREREGLKADVITFNVTIKGASGNLSLVTEGKKLTFQGYQFDNGSKNITVFNYSDIKIK